MNFLITNKKANNHIISKYGIWLDTLNHLNNFTIGPNIPVDQLLLFLPAFLL